MYLVILGIVLLVGKMAAFSFFADLSWWFVAAPFIGAVLWWNFSDTSGLTQKREMNRMEARKKDRRERAMAALGLDTARDKRASATRADVARRSAASKGMRSMDPTQVDHPPSASPTADVTPAAERSDPRL